MHMARIDPSFNAGDIIRLWYKNLDSDERKEVLLFFWFIVPGLLLSSDQVLSVLSSIADLLPRRGYRRLVRLLVILLRLLRRFGSEIWVEIIFRNVKTKRQVIGCLEVF